MPRGASARLKYGAYLGDLVMKFHTATRAENLYSGLVSVL